MQILPQLGHLELQGTLVSPCGLGALVEAPQLRHLALEGSDLAVDAPGTAAARLAALRSLTQLASLHVRV